MNFYATSPNAFDDLAETTALVLSTHAALALAGAIRRERIDNLERALQTNREIGVAIGILMTRHLGTQQQAFDLLRVASQRTHRKISDLAQDVIDTGDLEFPGPGYRRRLSGG
jgi:AmiR/NasT family two-component response regulator